MTTEAEAVTAVRDVLRVFNEGYATRDMLALDVFTGLFVDTDDLEVVGISGVSPGRGAWRLGRAEVRKLVKGDWEYWGQIAADVDNARIYVLGDVAWLSTAATVTTFEDTAERLQDDPEHSSPLADKETTGTFHVKPGGEGRIKPLRLTAVLVKQGGRWRFHQLHFSLPIESKPKAPAETI